MAVLSALIFLAPIRRGDLAGYDDASYAHMAREIFLTSDWLSLRSNGYPVVEHPPLLPWMQAAFFHIFGLSDFVAKLPSALCGLGTVLLVYWLARRLLSEWHGVLAMLAMAGSVYFIKYSARAMTDAPITFLFVAAICCWIRTEDDARWSLAAGFFTGLALMTRGFMGFGLPVIFAAYAFAIRRWPPLRYAGGALILALLPLSAWYGWQLTTSGEAFITGHMAWLDRQVYGGLSPAWRRYTGAPEYAFMLAKSYWPWLPFTIVGLVTIVRTRDRRLSILAIWAGIVFALCAVTRSRVLRYMLPAYPAFAVLASIGLLKLFSIEHTRRALSFVIPLLSVGVVWLALFPPVRLHAEVVRRMAAVASSATAAGERVAFYDEGQPRFDETNQMLWYGDRNLYILLTPAELRSELDMGRARVFVVDRGTYDSVFSSRRRHEVIATSGHLVCLRLLA